MQSYPSFQRFKGQPDVRNGQPLLEGMFYEMRLLSLLSNKAETRKNRDDVNVAKRI